MINAFSFLIRTTSFFVMIILFGCSTPYGLVKTPNMDPERQVFPSLGISAEIPREAECEYSKYVLKVYESEYYQKYSDCKVTLSIRMHPYWFGSALAEPQYILNFTFHRLSSVAFEKFKNGKHLVVNSNICFKNYSSIFSSNINMMNYKEPDSIREFLLFRKVLILPDGDAVLCGARLERIYEKNNNETDDINTVRQLIDSIKIL